MFNNFLNLTKASDLLTPDASHVFLAKMREYLDLYTSSLQLYPEYILLKPIDYFAYERTMYYALNMFAPALDNQLPQQLRFDGILVFMESIQNENAEQKASTLSPLQFEHGNQQETNHNKTT